MTTKDLYIINNDNLFESTGIQFFEVYSKNTNKLLKKFKNLIPAVNYINNCQREENKKEN